MPVQKVLIVDSRKMMLALTKSFLEQHDLQVEVAATSEAAWQKFGVMRPDVLVTNVQVESATTGVELANDFLALQPKLRIVFLSELPDFRSLGITSEKLPPTYAYLNRNRLDEPQRIVDAVLAKHKPGALAGFRDDKIGYSALSALSRTQTKVLRLVALGFTNQEIAAQRQVTQRAVESLLNRIASTLNIDLEPGSNSRIKLARAFIREAGLPL